MTMVPLTIHLPADLWRAVQSLAPHEGDANTVVLRALAEYVTATQMRPGRPGTGKYQKLVHALSAPIEALNLSARPANALHVMNIRYVYELVALEPRALRGRENFSQKSFREVTEKLAALGLTLGMPVDEETYRAAVVATVAANIEVAKV